MFGVLEITIGISLVLAERSVARKSGRDPIEGIFPLVPVEDDLCPIPASEPFSKQTSSSPASKIERPFLSVKRPENHPYTPTGITWAFLARLRHYKYDNRLCYWCTLQNSYTYTPVLNC